MPEVVADPVEPVVAAGLAVDEQAASTTAAMSSALTEVTPPE
jgi:hypothetical protein